MLSLKCSLSALFFICTGLMSCQNKTASLETLNSNEFLIQANEQATNVMVHDIFSPPVASRIYAYASLAAYEVAALSDENYQSMMGQLNGFEASGFDLSKEYLFPLAALTAYYEVATAMVFSEDQLTVHRDRLYQSIQKQGVSKQVFQNSLELGKAVASHVLAYASKDNYHQSRSFEKHTVSNDAGAWKPTPPAYMEGLEPHWAKMRPFVMDSSNQFAPDRPSAFDIEPESDFYKEAEAVMLATNHITEEQREIAFFWDCNPYKVNVKGHVMYAEKKITPGGHWMGIAGIAAKTKDLDWKQTAETFAMTSLALYDGFLSCWDEKYRSVLIRPETYINEYMDEDWLPLLQTPPFPEYTSGHSVVSAAASIVLTSLLGDDVAFVDSTEVVFGLPVREFPSFRKAAEEAAISRFYGGIHYMPAIVNGMRQGDQVGQLIVDRVQTRSTPVIASNKGE